jgi:DNA polymerase
MTLVIDERRQAILGEMGLRFVPLREAPQPEPVPAVAPEPALPGAAHRAELPTAGMTWDELEQAVRACQACRLAGTRANVVFGVGNPQAEWMVIGEAPGENEDLQGEPFVGQAGKLLDNMLRSIGLSRERNVYIANLLKCRPPGNRNPALDELAECEPFLRRQVEIVQPKIMLAMGRFAVQTLLGTSEAIGKLRGQAHEYLGVPVIVTYHPAYLLRNLADKGKAWSDLCLAAEVAAQAGAVSRSAAT